MGPRALVFKENWLWRKGYDRPQTPRLSSPDLISGSLPKAKPEGIQGAARHPAIAMDARIKSGHDSGGQARPGRRRAGPFPHPAPSRARLGHYPIRWIRLAIHLAGCNALATKC